MNIIIGHDEATRASEKYLVLELDTIQLAPDQEEFTAYCVISNESVPLQEIPTLANMEDLHKNLLKNYKLKNWNFCEQAIEHLLGKWKGELDTFYTEIAARVTKYKEQDPGDEWNGIYKKYAVNQ
jgi:hypothetical protein